MSSSTPGSRPIDTKIDVDVRSFGRALSRARAAAKRLGAAFSRPKIRHLPRRSGVGARQVLQPWTGKALRHPWAHERDAYGRVIPLVPGGGPLPQREL